MEEVPQAFRVPTLMLEPESVAATALLCCWELASTPMTCRFRFTVAGGHKAKTVEVGLCEHRTETRKKAHGRVQLGAVERGDKRFFQS